MPGIREGASPVTVTVTVSAPWSTVIAAMASEPPALRPSDAAPSPDAAATEPSSARPVASAVCAAAAATWWACAQMLICITTMTSKPLLPQHNRYDFVPLPERKDYSWPQGKRLAFALTTNVEWFAFGAGLGHDPAKTGEPQTHRNYSWRDYGNRIGVWRLLELFEPRIARIHKLVFPLLLDASTPLPRNLRILSQSLVDLHGHLAEGFLNVLQHAVEGFQRPKRRRDTLAARALGSLRRQYELSLRAASGTPPGFWKQMNQLLLNHQQSPDSYLDSPSLQVVHLLLAVHAAQAEALTPREQEFLWRHAEHLAAQVELSTTLPRKTDAWLWVDTHDERAPTPANRRAPPTAVGSEHGGPAAHPLPGRLLARLRAGAGTRGRLGEDVRRRAPGPAHARG